MRKDWAHIILTFSVIIPFHSCCHGICLRGTFSSAYLRHNVPCSSEHTLRSSSSEQQQLSGYCPLNCCSVHHVQHFTEEMSCLLKSTIHQPPATIQESLSTKTHRVRGTHVTEQVFAAGFWWELYPLAKDGGSFNMQTKYGNLIPLHIKKFCCLPFS